MAGFRLGEAVADGFSPDSAVPDVYQALTRIAADRARDPLAPVTVIAPSHAAALQLRRRLADITPFAAVRFEALPRVAELLGAGPLAAAGRSPLARPIGDYVAELVGRESRGALADVGDLPGYARVLRQIFRRLRRGGIRSSAGLPRGTAERSHLPEILRLYDAFRRKTAQFYDEEDLLDAAAEALRSRNAGVLPDLGEIYIAPPGPLTAAGNALLEALREAAPRVTSLDEPDAAPDQTFVIAPDPAGEAQEAVRTVLAALEGGTPLHEIAVFHGAGEGYDRLLREAFAAAGVPSVPLPGIPLSETRAGRGVLSLGRLPELDYSRTATVDFLSVAPIREWLPGTDGDVHERTTSWDKVSRDAGVTRGIDRWRDRLTAYIGDREQELPKLDTVEYENKIAAYERELDVARSLLSAIEALYARLEPLRRPQPASGFIDAFKGIVASYMLPDADGLPEALEEIDQLGTVGAVGGEFSLGTFAESLGANLDARYIRPESLGNGVIVADYRAAAGMRFQRVIICGAFEGAFPAGPGTDPILDDRVWQELRRSHPFIEDAAERIDRAKQAAVRAITAGASVTWSAPAFEPGGTREYYPSPLMAEAFSRATGRQVTASDLRRSSGITGVLSKASSPLAVALRGPLLSGGELALREAVRVRQRNARIGEEHARWRAVQSLRARRGSEFSAWDGNISDLADDAWLQLQRAVSPTSLEEYAACGFRYFCKSLLRLQTVEEPDERQVMDPATRGSLIHEILESFYKEQHERGRPAPAEPWAPADQSRLMAIAEEVLAAAKKRGQTGLDVFLEHEARTIRADLARFLEADNLFREETGAVPSEFEVSIPETEIAGVLLRGRVDRIDRTPDGQSAWVIDYKTGSAWGIDKMEKDPLAGGTKLQLPTYLAAVRDAASATAMYWFITQRGGFARPSYTPTPELQERFEATLRAIVGGIREGAFPAVPGEDDEYRNRFENCSYCDFDRICSRRRDLEFVSKAGDRGMIPWHTVAETAAPENGA